MAGELARAKINLFLHVLGRRADGYHLLDSLAVFAGAADRVQVEPGEGLRLSVTGPFAAALAGTEPGDNLILRAARALPRPDRAGAHLTLEKALPVASGIGGGSADAAAALRLLHGFWGMQLDPAALGAVALSLGADVPVCLRSQPARMGGIGEVIAPAPGLPPAGLLLINPGVAVATAAVFAARSGPYSEPARLPPRWDTAEAMAATLADLRNDLEQPAISVCPAIAAALDWIRQRPGCLLARMSGSGATCFGLFASGAQAQAQAAAVPGGWWRWAGGLA